MGQVDEVKVGEVEVEEVGEVGKMKDSFRSRCRKRTK